MLFSLLYIFNHFYNSRKVYEGWGSEGLSSSLSSVVADKSITGCNQVPAPLSSTHLGQPLAVGVI